MASSVINHSLSFGLTVVTPALILGLILKLCILCRFNFPMSLNHSLVCVVYFQVPKKKKKTKKSKGDDNDSGVEVYFREEEDKEDGEDPKSDSVKVSESENSLKICLSHVIIQNL